MKRVMIGLLALALAAGAAAPGKAQTGQQTFRIDVTGGVIEPLPFAAPIFIAETAEARQVAQDITRVLRDDLVSSGLLREVPREAHISQITNFNSQPQFQDWKAINAQGLIVGSVSVTGNQLVVKFRLWDVFAETAIGDGLQLAGGIGSWRRIAHKLADAAYTRITGEGGYFDSRVVFVSESGPKDKRVKRLAIMDQDGANVRFLTSGQEIVLSPRFSPSAKDILYTSYETGEPRVYIMNVDTGQRRALDQLTDMTFGPRFSPNAQSVIVSIVEGTNTDLFRIDLATGQRTRLTSNPAIETAPSYSPDGQSIVFESDRGGTQQLYVMSANGGEARRISFGAGRYATPVWSPRGDLVAFTKLQGGRRHIGVMRLDGSQEQLLTASLFDEGPTWSANGRVLMFFRETAGEQGAPKLYSVDVSGRNLRQIPTPENASDPAWSGLLP